jgi:hypothetical protein
MNSFYKVLTQFDLNNFLQTGMSNHVWSIAVNESETEIYINTYGSEIYKLYSEQEKPAN